MAWSFSTLQSSKNTIAILGDRWWPQEAKQDRDKNIYFFISYTWKQRIGRPNVWEALSIWSRNGAPSRNECSQWSNDVIRQATNEYPPPPPSASPPPRTHPAFAANCELPSSSGARENAPGCEEPAEGEDSSSWLQDYKSGMEYEVYSLPLTLAQDSYLYGMKFHR